MTADTAVLPPMTAADPAPPRPRLVPPARHRHRLRARGLPASPSPPSSSSSPASASASGCSSSGWASPCCRSPCSPRRGFATVERAWLPAVLDRPLPQPGVPAGRREPPRPQADHAAARPAVVAGRAARDRPVPRRDLLVRRDGDLLVGRARRPQLRRLGLGAARRPADNKDLLELLGFDPTYGEVVAVYTFIGLVFAVLLPFAVRGVAAAAGRARPRPAHLPRGHPGRARPGSPRAATPPSPPRRSPCAGSSATSTTARSSGWSG